MAPGRVLVGMLLAVATLASFGCRGSGVGNGKVDWLIGRWSTPVDLTLNLSADQRFTMGPGEKTDFAGEWTLTGNRLQLHVETIGGKPIDDALRERMQDSARVMRMSPADEEKAIADLKDSIETMNLTASANRTRLIWHSSGGDTEFTKSDELAQIDLADEARIRANLHVGMHMHELMAYFRTSEGSSRGSPDDPTLEIEEFVTSFRGKETTVVAFYRRIGGKLGLEWVEIVRGTERKKITLSKRR